MQVDAAHVARVRSSFDRSLEFCAICQPPTSPRCLANSPGRPAQRGRTGRGKGRRQGAKRRRERRSLPDAQRSGDAHRPTPASRGVKPPQRLSKPRGRGLPAPAGKGGRQPPGRAAPDDAAGEVGPQLGGDANTGRTLHLARGGRAPGADALHFADPPSKSIARALKGAAAQPGGRRRAAPPGTGQRCPAGSSTKQRAAERPEQIARGVSCRAMTRRADGGGRQSDANASSLLYRLFCAESILRHVLPLPKGDSPFASPQLD